MNTLRKMQFMFLTSALLIAGLSARAAQVTVTLVSVGVTDGVNNVLPYEISIDSVLTAADCYDFFDGVQVGQTWQANKLTLAQASTSGLFSGKPNALAGYELIAALSAEAATTSQAQIDLQHAIWNVFDPLRFAVTTGVANDLAAANAAIAGGFDFSTVAFIEAVKGSNIQALVVSSNASEPPAIALAAIGLTVLCIPHGLISRLRLFVPRDPDPQTPDAA